MYGNIKGRRETMIIMNDSEENNGEERKKKERKEKPINVIMIMIMTMKEMIN